MIKFRNHNCSMSFVGIFNILFGNFNQNNFVTRAVDNNNNKKMVNKMK